MPTQIKICGMTTEDDVFNTAFMGVHYLGFIFWEKSPRYIDIEKAKKLVIGIPSFVQPVGVFVNPTREYVESVISQVHLSKLQFHGEESRQFCESFNMPYIKTLHMNAQSNVDVFMQKHPHMYSALLDVDCGEQYGGSGKTFDWNLIPKNLDKRIMVAGGLNVQNVGQVIQQVRPYAVDVLSGVEKEKGIKDLEKIKAFIEEVKRVDQEK